MRKGRRNSIKSPQQFVLPFSKEEAEANRLALAANEPIYVRYPVRRNRFVPHSPPRPKFDSPEELAMHALVRKLANYRCEDCGVFCWGNIDHRIPRHLGGSDEVWNRQLLCESCHNKKTKEEREFAQKLRLGFVSVEKLQKRRLRR